MRTTILASAVAAALLLTGCAGGATGGQPTVGTTPSTSPTSPSTPTGTAFPTDPATAVIEISLIDATVGGIQGEDRIVVYGDGTVLRPDDDGGWTVAHLAPGVLDRIAEQAAADGLFGPVDYGDPGVTDMGWADIDLVTTTGPLGHHVYAPSWTDNLTPDQVAAREAFSAFVSTITSLTGSDLVAAAQPYEPERLLMRGFSGAALAPDEAGEWYGPTPLRDLIGTEGCAVLTGDDLTAAADLMREDAPVMLATGVEVPAHLQLRLQLLLPHDEGCPVLADREPLVEPWPADDRVPATAWQRWIADQALVAGTERNAFGPDASSTADLTWYEYDYSAGTVDGVTVIDVVASPGYGSERDPETFAVRVDEATGEILDQL